MIDDADLQPVVANTFMTLADRLDTISDLQWGTTSLCEGWRVREVVAHVTMAARYSEEAFMAELRTCDFDFTLLSDRIAVLDANLPTAEHAHLQGEPLSLGGPRTGEPPYVWEEWSAGEGLVGRHLLPTGKRRAEVVEDEAAISVVAGSRANEEKHAIHGDASSATSFLCPRLQ
jgi:hypothetical protein